MRASKLGHSLTTVQRDGRNGRVLMRPTRSRPPPNNQRAGDEDRLQEIVVSWNAEGQVRTKVTWNEPAGVGRQYKTDYIDEGQNASHDAKVDTLVQSSIDLT